MPDEDVPMSDAGLPRTSKSTAIMAWDHHNCIPLDHYLSKDDLILLLTPVVVSDATQTIPGCDPFEPLGQALAQRHHVVRHVPYTKNGGINGVHVAFVKKADVVIFVVTGLPRTSETSQLDLAKAVSEACDSRPLVVVLCCTVLNEILQQYHFSTIVRSSGFTLADLGAVSSLLLNGADTPSQPMNQPTSESASFEPWKIEQHNNARHLEECYGLWTHNIPRQFRLDRSAFASILIRDECSWHYVVRDPSKGTIIGWCATYATYAGNNKEQLIGSIAYIVVEESSRKQGIGSALYKEAFGKLRNIQGARQIQLGTSFPRLLYSLPSGRVNEKWFQNRGWTVDQLSPGKGRLMADWLLWFSASPLFTLASAGLSFRPCELADDTKVLELVERESERQHGFGWYAQYIAMLNKSLVGEVFVGFEGATMVASAITYMPNSGNPTASDIPWPATIGIAVGGITCIYDPGIISRRDTIEVRLLNACCEYLRSRNMTGAFLDGLKSDEAGVERLGFHRWAEYRDIWRCVQQPSCSWLEPSPIM